MFCSVSVQTRQVTRLQQLNPLPLFRDYPTYSKVTLAGDSVLEHQAGLNTGRRFLPYLAQDHYDFQHSEQPVMELKLENSLLAATFWPEWGGRLISLFDKQEGRELLWAPERITLANLAIRNAWFAGGIEWNLGYYGHTVNTAETVFCARVGENDNLGLRIANYDRMMGLWWQIDFSLAPTAPLLLANVTVFNDNRDARDLYWWTNIAVTDNHKDKRIFTSAKRGIFRNGLEAGFEVVDLPYVRFPGGSEFDTSYQKNYPASGECFFLSGEQGLPWMGTFDRHGKGLVEASSSNLPYRKIFAWGQHRGAQNWQKLLSRGEEGEYFEVQAGLSPSQLHTDLIAAKSYRSWSQVFAPMSISPEVYAGEFHRSSALIAAELRQRYAEWLATSARQAQERRLLPPSEVYCRGTDWAALPLQKKPQESLLPVWYFSSFLPPEGPKKQVQRWCDLINEERWSSIEGNEPAWVLDPDCQHALEKKIAAGQGDWEIALHLGVIYRENFSFAAAREMFLSSLNQRENIYAYWGLIELSSRIFSQPEEALRYCNACQQLAPPPQLQQKIVSVLLDMGQWQRAREVLSGLSKDVITTFLASEAIQVALHFDQLEEARELLLSPHHMVREGDTTADYCGYWQQLQQKLFERGLVTRREAPPPQLDYRMKLPRNETVSG